MAPSPNRRECVRALQLDPAAEELVSLDAIEAQQPEAARSSGGGRTRLSAEQVLGEQLKQSKEVSGPPQPPTKQG